LLEAWRILRRASMDRVLLSSSEEFEKWHNDICVEYSEQAILQDQALPLLAAGAGSATPGSTISAVVPASGSGVSYVTLRSTISLADVHGEHAPARSEESAISAADVEEKLGLKKERKFYLWTKAVRVALVFLVLQLLHQIWRQGLQNSRQN
jgi:hypothetical protein